MLIATVAAILTYFEKKSWRNEKWIPLLVTEGVEGVRSQSHF